MCQSNGTWASERQISPCLLPRLRTTLSLFFVARSLLTLSLFIMRSPVSSVLFLALFALLFGAVYAAPITSPNVSTRKRSL
ncbi:hypothetical protein H4582DRAFT_1400091 [Lactarius indigo]|nr:hypothetical protein H4582DRAFT_1400091 [Lactarius indigo]